MIKIILLDCVNWSQETIKGKIMNFHKILKEVAKRLIHIEYKDLTPTEAQIAELLLEEKYLSKETFFYETGRRVYSR